MELHDLSRVLARREAEGRPYLEFIRVPGMSVGLYVLAPGATDRQQPHAEDEVYHVVAGRARIRVADEVAPVAPGSVVFVAAGVPHRFEEIEEELRAVVLFAPAESAG
jgi:mannose-6-phosphate isomerase-like protein (cupin superfamily)